MHKKDLDALLNDSQMDQLETGMINLAKALAVYKNSLLSSGFSEEEAFTMVLHYQQQILVNGAISHDG